jgi:hypothetical protein
MVLVRPSASKLAGSLRLRTLVCTFGLAALPLWSEVKLQVRDGRPIIDGIYVNGHGPYRFLVDTGSNVNLIETGLAKKIGMNATFAVDLTSVSRKTSVHGSNGNELAIGSVKAADQQFLFSPLDAIHRISPDIQGVLGQGFLNQFDYVLDLHGQRLEFGKQERTGARVAFKMINARPVVHTSLGYLALDSGADWVILYGIKPEIGGDFMGELRSVSGSTKINVVTRKPLLIDGRKIWGGDALAIPDQPEPGVDGLLPLSLFKAIYVCNSESYVVFE